MDIFIVIFFIIILLLFVWGLWYLSTHSNSPTGPSGHTGNLGEVPPPDPPSPLPGYQYTLQFINKTNQTILLGAAGPTLPISPTGTLPINGEKWTIPSGQYITVGIPDSWLGPNLSPGPRFWARTGCKYDAVSGYAQCESGECNLRYDCQLPGSAPASLAEFCFNCGSQGNEVIYDVSLVDGYNLSINIIPIGGSATNPNDPTDPHWNVTNICNTGGADLRASCPTQYQLKSSDLSWYIPGNPDNIIACFSNCGYAAYTGNASGPNWEKYCCQYPTPGCSGNTGCNDATVCWGAPGTSPTCQCHGWTSGPTCGNNVCTFQNEAPPYSQCTDGCVGDDTFHTVCPYAFSWPNDSQNQATNAKVFQVIFGQGGQGTQVPITPAGPLTACSSLPSEYNANAYIGPNGLCGNTSPGTYYYGARKTTDNPPQWDCNVPLTGNTTGVLCYDIQS